MDVDIHINFQPPAYVLEMCGDQQPWGCIRFMPAVDNPNDLDCFIRMSVILVDLPAERRYVEDDLRAQCAAGP